MLYTREGFPEDSEIVLCTVTKIQSHAVFVELDEYGKGGMIHISEIAPGRIRNIRDFVRDGKKVVCKVLRINEERGYIDLSLRRVNDSQRRMKVEEIKQEQVAEKIAENVAGKLKIDFKAFYEELTDKIFKDYEMLQHCFNDVVRGSVDLTALGLDKKAADLLAEEIKARIKPSAVSIEGSLNLLSYEPDGVSVVREGLKKLLTASTEEAVVTLHYLGAGNYQVKVTAPDYKKAEGVLKAATDLVSEHMKKHDGIARFVRQE